MYFLQNILHFTVVKIPQKAAFFFMQHIGKNEDFFKKYFSKKKKIVQHLKVAEELFLSQYCPNNHSFYCISPIFIPLLYLCTRDLNHKGCLPESNLSTPWGEKDEKSQANTMKSQSFTNHEVQ